MICGVAFRMCAQALAMAARSANDAIGQQSCVGIGLAAFTGRIERVRQDGNERIGLGKFPGEQRVRLLAFELERNRAQAIRAGNQRIE